MPFASLGEGIYLSFSFHSGTGGCVYGVLDEGTVKVFECKIRVGGWFFTQELKGRFSSVNRVSGLSPADIRTL